VVLRCSPLGPHLHFFDLHFYLHLPRSPAPHPARARVADSKTEKPARAALFTAATRSLRPDNITILDSANYIKGFRYQLYCAAREAGVRVATIRVAAPPGKCAEWHEALPKEERYAQGT
jgi:protein KTI12